MIIFVESCSKVRAVMIDNHWLFWLIHCFNSNVHLCSNRASNTEISINVSFWWTIFEIDLCIVSVIFF